MENFLISFVLFEIEMVAQLNYALYSQYFFNEEIEVEAEA